jgi:hypothetical protein
LVFVAVVFCLFLLLVFVGGACCWLLLLHGTAMPSLVSNEK